MLTMYYKSNIVFIAHFTLKCLRVFMNANCDQCLDCSAPLDGSRPYGSGKLMKTEKVIYLRMIILLSI